MAITFRDEKGAPLTHEELDANFRSFFFTASFGENNLTLQRKDGVTVNVPVGGEAFADFQANGGSIGDVFIASSQITGSRIIIDLLQGQFYDKTKAMGSDGGGLSSDEWYIDFDPAASSPYFVHFGSNFAISSSGHLYATDANIEGDITASAGLIGGFSVNRDAISGPTSLGIPSFYISGSAGLNDHFISASNFNIKGSGDITGSAVLFSGGTVAGWDITNSQIRKGSNVVLDATNESISIKNSTFGNQGIQLEYNSGAPRFYVGDGASSFVKFDGTDITVSTRLLEISASNIEISSTEASMSLGNGNIELLGQEGKIVAGTTNKVRLEGNETDAFLVAGAKTGFATNDAGVIIGMDATVPTLDLTKDANNYLRFNTTNGVDIKTDTFKLDTTYFDIDSSTQRVNIFDTASAEIIRLGEISDDASDLYGLKIFDGSGTGSAQTIAMFGQQGNKIGGWEVTDSQIRSIPNSGYGGTYAEDETGLIIHSDGRLESSNFVTNVKGWRIDTLGNGSAEFENMRIRGTLRTTVFEKESVNVVGGQLMVANATTIQPLRSADGTIIAGSSSYADTAVTFSVANVSGFIEGEILKAKSVDTTGFSVEYFYVSGSSRYSQHGNLNYQTGSIDPDGLAGEIYVERNFGGVVAVSSSATTLAADITTTTETTMTVASTASLALQNIIKIDNERFKITGFGANNTVTVIRNYNDTDSDSHTVGDVVYVIDTNKEFLAGLVSTAKPYNEGQVLVSTGVFNPSENISSGYIVMNANPRDVSTPYMDIVERTGSGVYDLQLRTRLGDLSGLSSGYLYGNNEPGFGIYTENGFFKGAITAQTGSIAGILHVATELGGIETGQKISIGREVQGSNDGIFVNNNNYWYTDGAWKVGGSQNFISLDNFTDGNLTIRTETFTLDTPNMIISSSLNNGTITMGANADTITETAESGIYMDGTGKFRVGTATTGENYIYWNGSTLNIKGAIDITGGTGVNTDELNAATSSLSGSLGELISASDASYSASVESTTSNLDSKIFTDSSGRAVKAPTANTAGLYMASTHLGFYKSGEWKTYMDDQGDFFLTGSNGDKLVWDSSTGTLEIKGAINITGNGNAATQTFASASAASAESASLAALANVSSSLSASISSSNASLQSSLDAVDALAQGKTSIFKQPNAPTATRVGDMWIESDEQNRVRIWDGSSWTLSSDSTYDQEELINATSSSLSASIALDLFTDSTGKIVRPPNASDTGLYLGDSNLGFYDNGEWKTYMADNGNFFLTGSASNYLYWDGINLNIAGAINITSGNAATTSSVDTAVSGAIDSGSAAAATAQANAQAYTNQATSSLSGSFSSSLGEISSSLDTSISASQSTQQQISASQAQVNQSISGVVAGKNAIFRQTSAPSTSGRTSGDVWIDSDDKNKVYIWTGNPAAWTVSSDDSITSEVSQSLIDTSGSFALTTFTDSTGLIQRTPNPSSAGLYLGDSNLGFYESGKWKTYMANNGNFFLTGSSGGFLKWENGSLFISGDITVTGGNASTKDFVNAATSSLSGSLSSSIASEATIASASTAAAQQTANLASFEAALAEQAALTASLNAQSALTRSVDAEGKITFPATPSGAGLFLGSDNLGYYNGTGWKTYMSSSGDFFLSGDGDNSLSWDGTDLSIDGTIVARDGSIGGIELDADKMYIGTGTHGHANTPFFTSQSGDFSLGDKLVWDGNNLTIEGSITVTNSNDFASQAELDAATGSLEDSIGAVQTNLTNTIATTSSLANPSTYAFGPSATFTLSTAVPQTAGLYLGSNNLGYYNGGWKAYMDSSGNFLLSGNGDDGLTWDGSTLRIGNKGVGPSLAYQFNGALDSNVFDFSISNTTTISTPVIGSTFKDNGGSWNQGFHSKALFDRQDGVIFEWDIMVGPAWAEVMVGLYRENPSSYNHNQMSHAVFFDTDNDIRIYESGSQRSEIGTNAWTTDDDYSEKQTFRIRIQPLPTGAKYEIFKNGDFTTPAYTYNSAGSGITERYLRPGAAISTPNSSNRGVIFQGIAGGASLGQATKISGNTIQTGVIESSNLSTALGSQFNLNDGTFKLGGTTSPDLHWNGSTLSVRGNITVTNPESFATPAEKNKEDFKIILLSTGSIGSTNTDSLAYLASQGYTGGNGSTHFYDNNNNSDGNTNPANISGYDTEDYDLYVFDNRNWGIDGSEIKLALDLFDNGKSVLITGNDTTAANYTGSYNTEWPILSTTSVSGTGWMAGGKADVGVPNSHPILAGITGNIGTSTSGDSGATIRTLKAFPKGGTVVQPFSEGPQTGVYSTTSNGQDVWAVGGGGSVYGITSFIATNPRGGRLVNLNMFALATTGTYASLSAQAAKNLTSFLLRTDPAIESYYMQVTSITGEMVTTGKINSTNLNEGSGTYTTEGTLFDLDNGAIKSKSFAIDSNGNANFKGNLSGANISGATGTFTGTVQIGGTNLTANNTLNENNPTTVLYTFNGSQSIPTNTNSGSASTFTFTSDREGTARIRLVINDAEAGGTYPNYSGIQASVNGNKLLTRLNIYDLGLADGSDGTFFDTVQVVSGSNNIKIWSSTGDGGSTKEIEVIYTQTEDITSGSAGGWTIDSSAIFSGTKDTNAFSTNGITFSSANGGSIHAEQFYIDTNGNAFFKGDLNGASITGATGTFTGTVQVGGTSLTTANTLNTEDPMSAGSVVFNPNFLQVAGDGRPAGAKAVYGSATQSNISYLGSASDGVLKLASSDNTIGVGFNAFPINPGAKYKFSIRLKQSAAYSSGLYIRVAEKDSELSIGKTHLSSNSTGETGVEPGDRNIQTNTGNSVTGVGRITNVTSLDHNGTTTNLSSLENIAVTTNYRVIQGIYTPNPSAKYASFFMLNWSGAGTSEMHIDRVYVSETTEDVYTGTVAGWNIDSQNIYSSPTPQNADFTTEGITLNAGGSIHTPNFYVSESGDAFFRGMVTGSVVKGTNVVGSLVYGGTVEGATLQGGSLAIPHVTASNFSVDSAGFMSASNANIVGEVVATGGKIGEWVIDSNTNSLRDADTEIELYPGDSQGGHPEIRLFSGSAKKVVISPVGQLTDVGGQTSNITLSTSYTTPAVSSYSTSTNANSDVEYTAVSSTTYTPPQAGDYVVFINRPAHQIEGTTGTNPTGNVSYPNYSPSGYTDHGYESLYQKRHEAEISLQAVDATNSSNVIGEISLSTSYAYGATTGYTWYYTTGSSDDPGDLRSGFGPDGPALSVTGDTQIQLADGSVKLAEDVKEGDIISTWDWIDSNDTLSTTSVGKIHTRLVDDYYTVTLASGRQVKTSDSHGFWLDNNEEIKTTDLIPGESEVYITTPQGIEKDLVESVEHIQEPVQVYTLEVPVYNNYISNGILSHNPVVWNSATYSGTSASTTQAYAATNQQRTLTLSSAIPVKFRYKIEFRARSGRGHTTSNTGATSYNYPTTTVDAWTTAPTLDTSLTIQTPSNFVEMKAGGLQVVSSDTKYVRMDRLDATGDDGDILFKTKGGTMKTHHIEPDLHNDSNIGWNVRYRAVGACTGSFRHSLQVGADNEYSSQVPEDLTQSNLSSANNSWGNSGYNLVPGFYIRYGLYKPYNIGSFSSYSFSNFYASTSSSTYSDPTNAIIRCNWMLNANSNTSFYIRMPYGLASSYIGWTIRFWTLDDSGGNIYIRNSFPGTNTSTSTFTLAGGQGTEMTYMGNRTYYDGSISDDMWVRTMNTIDFNW